MDRKPDYDEEMKKKVAEWDRKIIHYTFTILLSALTAAIIVAIVTAR